MPPHGSGAGAVACEGAVHHGEDAGMYLLLDCQEVNEGLVDDGVGVVSLPVKQPTEGVFHGPGHPGEDVGLHGGELDYVLPDEGLGDLDSVGEDVVEGEHLGLGPVLDPADGVFLKVHVGEVVLVGDDLLLVANLAFPGVDDHGAVVRGDEVGVAV